MTDSVLLGGNGPRKVPSNHGGCVVKRGTQKVIPVLCWKSWVLKLQRLGCQGAQRMESNTQVTEVQG